MNRPARQWDLPLDLHADAEEPLFLQISRALAADIQRGRLRPGTRLPGSRTLARSLGVHRNTVLAAFAELSAEGWIESTPASGTFVARSLPSVKPRAFASRAMHEPGALNRLGFELRYTQQVSADSDRPPDDALIMSGGIPDVRLVPVADLARAYRRALRECSRTVLSYGDARGEPRLRAALAAMLAANRGLPVTADDVLITNGSQGALDLVGRALIGQGDVVAVEALGYRYASELFRRHGAKLATVPVDEQGLDVAALEKLTESTPIRAVYVTPHHQYPTMVTMTASRRVALLALAQRERFAILEDDYDHEFHYQGRPVLPLASADRAGVVVYIGTLSKILAPGIRMGYIVAPRPLLEHLATLRMYLDRHGDRAVQLAVAHLLDQGILQRHVRRARRIYHARRDLLAAELQRSLGDTLSFSLPTGGMAIWANVRRGVDLDAWVAQALARKVVIHPARRFALDGKPRPCVRLGFAALNESELMTAVHRLRNALRATGT